MSLKICGLDLSINSPGVVVFELNDTLDVIGKDYLSFTTTKKIEGPHLTYYHKSKQFKNYFEKNDWISGDIFEMVHKCEYIGIEDYAYGAKGKVFHIAESAGFIKRQLYFDGHKLRLYDPGSIKILATGDGGCGKDLMDKAYTEYCEDKNNSDWFDLDHLTAEKSPKNDIIDAFWIAKLLQMELKLRRGLVNLKDYDEKTIKVFNRCTKAFPENILVRDFLINTE